MKQKSINEVIADIIQLEKDNSLYDIKLRGLYEIWPFYRMYFYFGFMKTLGLIETRRGFNKSNHIKNIKNFITLLFNSKLGRLLSHKEGMIYMFSSQRYVHDQEIYTKIFKDLSPENYIDMSFSENFNFHKGPIYLDFFKVLFKLSSKISYRFIKRHKQVEKFMEDLGASNRFSAEFKRYYLEFYLWFKLFNWIFKIKKPKKIFLVSGVYLTPIIAAAKNNEIKVYEIQHGVINSFHLAYHFPETNEINAFVDGILLFSDYWKFKADFPKSTELITIGNDFFAKKKRNKNYGDERYMLFVSQPIISNQMTSFIQKNIEFLLSLGYKIKYKLHPGEFNLWENENYPLLGDLHNSGRIEVVTNSISLDELLINSYIVFGVSSTALYEALDTSCNVFILNLPSHEYFLDLIENGVMKKIDVYKKLTYNDMKFKPKFCDSFFEPWKKKKVKELMS